MTEAKKRRNIGMAFAGGDASGNNQVDRVVVKYATHEYGDRVIGFIRGFQGLLDDSLPRELRAVEMTPEMVSGIGTEAGVKILKSHRDKPSARKDGLEKLQKAFDEFELDALIIVGGDDHIKEAYKLYDAARLPIICIPKTADGDVRGTKDTIGFSTAREAAIQKIGEVHATTDSHDQIGVVETMGRYTGWIAMQASSAAGADAVLIPEFPESIEEVLKVIEKRRLAGKEFTIVTVAEGCALHLNEILGRKVRINWGHSSDPHGHKALERIASHYIAKELAIRTGKGVRADVVGRSQRGRRPVGFDLWLAAHFAGKAVDLIHEGQFGRMVCNTGANLIDSVELSIPASGTKLVSREDYEKERRLIYGLN